jgi:hypothetical protein
VGGLRDLRVFKVKEAHPAFPLVSVALRETVMHFCQKKNPKLSLSFPVYVYQLMEARRGRGDFGDGSVTVYV